MGKHSVIDTNIIVSVTLRSKSTATLTTSLHSYGNRQAVLVSTNSKTHSFNPTDAEALADAIKHARKTRIPFLAIISTTETPVSEGASSAFAWGQVAKEMATASGVIPILIGIDGPIVSGVSLLLGLSDINVFTQNSFAYISGPKMVETYTGSQIDKEELGGSTTHFRTTGVANNVVSDKEEIIEVFNDYLSFFPNNVDQLPQILPTGDPINRLTPEASKILPDTASGSYDVRDVIEIIADDGYFFESHSAWATNLVTGFARFGGYPVGIIANQTQSLAGAIDIPASQKGAGFVSLCDAFNISLLTLVDTSGFLPGKDLEWRGMIRHGAQLAFAYARATVPRVCLILRKSYGGAYIVMDSRYMGNDLMLAWPSAEVAVMGAKGAVQILHRKASAEEQEELVKEYETKLLNPYPAAERGSISAVIDPSDTRKEITQAFELFNTKKEKLRPRKHDNSPL